MAQNSNWMLFYMDPRKVRGGNPPIDRQCRLCNRIGHFARNCTFTNRSDDRDFYLHDDDDGDGQGIYGQENTQGAYSEGFANSTMKIEPLHLPATEEIFPSMDLKDPVGGQSRIEGVVSTPSLVPAAPPQEDIYGQPIVPGLSFFGGDGNTNPEDTTIQSMIRNNSGVTFSLEKKKADDELAEQNRQAELLRQSAEMYLASNCMKPTHEVNHQAYIGSPHHAEKDYAEKRITPDEYMGGGRNALLNMQVPGQRIMTMGPPALPTGPFIPQPGGIYNGIGQPPPQQQQQPQQHAIAPPPGFPPLPNSCVYNYGNPAGVNIYNNEQMHQLNQIRQQMFRAPTPPSSDHQVMPNGAEEMMSQQGPQMSPPEHIFRGMYQDGAYQIMHMAPPVHNIGPYPMQNPEQNVMMSVPLSLPLPNGVIQNNGLIMTSANSTIMSIKSSPSLNMVQQGDYDNSEVGHMMPGYHLSHVHQAAVVSALPMQHSQHHPMQMHQASHMRPYPFRYGPMHGLPMSMQGPIPPFSGGPIHPSSHGGGMNHDDMSEQRGHAHE